MSAEDDDLSSLGDEDFDSPKKRIENDNVGDIDDERPATAGVYEMIVSGFRCPDDYVNVLTPMEFEEMVKFFLEYDVDGSKTIDKVNINVIPMRLLIVTTHPLHILLYIFIL